MPVTVFGNRSDVRFDGDSLSMRFGQSRFQRDPCLESGTASAQMLQKDTSLAPALKLTSRPPFASSLVDISTKKN